MGGSGSKERFIGHTSEINDLAFSLDGNFLASSAVGDKKVLLWDLPNRQRVLGGKLLGHSANVNVLAFSPNSKLLASGSTDHSIRLWAPQPAQACGHLQGHEGAVHTIAVKSDSKTLVSGSEDRTVGVWDLTSSTLIQRMDGHEGCIRLCRFSPDEGLVASASADRTVRLWDPRVPAAVATLTGHTDPVWTCVFSPDGATLVTTCGDRLVKIWDRNIRIWDIKQRKVLRSLNGHTDYVTSASFSTDGSMLATSSADRSVQLWHLRTQQPPTKLSGHKSCVTTCRFSNDGVLLASASEDATVRVYDARTRDIVQVIQDHTGPVRVCKFSPDGSLLASGSADKAIHVAYTQSMRQSIQLPMAAVSPKIPTSPSASHERAASVSTRLKTGEFKEVPYEALVQATNSWSDKNRLGNGGFGTVFSGELDGMGIAVKRLESAGEQGPREFLAEVTVLSRYRHRNVVSLLGSSVDGAALCLVYELMDGGSLADVLSEVRAGRGDFSWVDRLRIALDAARGLEFVHTAFQDPLLHLDFKSANVLLSAQPGKGDVVAKVGDFGLAQFMQASTASLQVTHVTMTRLAGTSAYIDPVYEQTGKAAPSSDIYSLGVMLLELLTGREPIGLVADAREHIMDTNAVSELADPKAEWPDHVSAAVCTLALDCTRMKRQRRPTTSEVVHRLEELIPVARRESTLSIPRVEPRTERRDSREPVVERQSPT
eukprot:TRINITY_DN10915_c0_g1_i1.p1 TRINITY_DN10915_c0_g1~~TRINITY_DN10915_c0_g1_i1.p1  ORF type:complete len:713 (+),score=133.83 TRINITY_DN10915_c0_g1_i1:105-2243(+)